MERISNIEQGISNDERQKGENGYQVNRKSGCRIPGISISGQVVRKIAPYIEIAVAKMLKLR